MLLSCTPPLMRAVSCSSVRATDAQKHSKLGHTSSCPCPFALTNGTDIMELTNGTNGTHQWHSPMAPMALTNGTDIMELKHWVKDLRGTRAAQNRGSKTALLAQNAQANRLGTTVSG